MKQPKNTKKEVNKCFINYRKALTVSVNDNDDAIHLVKITFGNSMARSLFIPCSAHDLSLFDVQNDTKILIFFFDKYSYRNGILITSHCIQVKPIQSQEAIV